MVGARDRLAQHVRVDVRRREVGDRIAPGLVQKRDRIAVRHDGASQLGAHESTGRLGVQDVLG